VQLLERQKKLGSTIGPDSGTSLVRVVDDEVPKQDMVSRGIRNSSRNKGNNLMGVK
jgi:hypothetical protein